MILVLLIITLIVFLVVRLLPGDPILLYLTSRDAEDISQERIKIIRHDLGLDRPLYVQYFDWLSHVAIGDLGNSIIHRGKVITDIKQRLPITLHIGLLAFALSIVIGIPLGVISAVRRKTWMDHVLTSLGNLGICVPVFWLGILLIYLFSYQLKWLPAFGYTSPLEDFWLNTKQIILPVFCIAAPGMASAVRLTRSSILEVLRQDYIRTALSKGLRERIVIVRHVLKNGLIPVITLKGMTMANIVGGSVLIETVFSIPGMGRLMVEAIFSRDYAVVQGVTLVVGIILLTVNLLIDLSYGWLDPKVRYN
jgi:peptide/nickel transport system permease protein